MSDPIDVVIVGAGHAGAQLAITLRQRKFAGRIALVGDEPTPPYERPPLSKDYLSGEKAFERILIRPEAFWEEREIQLLLNRQVTHVDPEAKTVTVSTGDTLGYRVLVWAAGGAPRRLSCSGANLKGVHSVRTRRDVDALVAELPTTSKVGVVGGGYIGLEAAAVLTKLGKQVTVFEAQDRVLARVAGETLSRFYEERHRAQGVRLEFNATVDCIVEDEGRASGVRLTSGDEFPCEMVIVGVGIIPAVAPLLAAGAAGENGVAVDEFCRTSLPNVFAIGDCAAHENRYARGERIRLESVQNANDQASIVAKAITGELHPYAAVPWFWSNQYDLRLQTVGLSTGHDEAVVRGDMAKESFSIVYLREGVVIALDCVNSTRDYVQGRALVTDAVCLPAASIVNAAIQLKELAAGANG